MQICEKFFKLLDKLISFFIMISMAGLLFCTFGQVAVRIFRISLSWTTELSQYFFLWSTVFSGYIATRQGKMIGVELVQNMFPPIVRRGLRFISWLVAAAFYGFVIYYCGVQMPQLMRQYTPILKWPMGVVYGVMMFGLTCMTIYFVYLALVQVVPANNLMDQEGDA